MHTILMLIAMQIHGESLAMTDKECIEAYGPDWDIMFQLSIGE